MIRCHHFLLLHSITAGLPCILQHCRIAGRPVHRNVIPVTQAAYLKQCISAVGPMSCWEIQQWTWSAWLEKCTVLLLFCNFALCYCCRASSMAPVPCLAECTARASFPAMSTCLPGCERNEPEECKGGALPCIDYLDKHNQFQNRSWEFCLRSARRAHEGTAPL